MSILNYFTYPFVRYAMIAGILTALCASMLGVPLVLKRYSFIGDGLSHVAFGAMAVAAVLGLTSNNMLVVLPITVAAAVFLLKNGRNTKIAGDAKIAMLSVGSMAAGYLLMNKFSASSNVAGDVCSSLFGSTAILTLKETDVLISAVMSVAVILVFTLLYNRIFSVTFDESFAESSGINVGKYNLFIAVLIAVIIVLAMNLVGSLLISALIVFPALSSMCIFKNYKSVIILSSVLSVASTAAGILVSVVFSTPVGATIVAVDIIVYFVCKIIGGHK